MSTVLKRLLDKIKGMGLYPYTCSADHPDDYSVTYAMNVTFWTSLEVSKKDMVVLVPESIRPMLNMRPNNKLKNVYVEDPAHMFVQIHNHLNLFEPPRKNKVHAMARIHPKAYIGADGMKYIKTDHGLINMKHMGNVIIEKNVELGPFCGVARATLDSTIVGEDSRLGYGVAIGHNCIIGKRNIIVDGAIIGGSVKTGDDCWFGLNCTVRNGVSVCDNVFVGMGALVTKNIDKPGTYVGMPARRAGDWDGSW